MKTQDAPQKPKIIAVVGPTASGKTALSINLAKKYNAEIVSADSRQVYRGMDIGTAKASGRWEVPARHNLGDGGIGGREEFISEGIIHHLVDIKNPDEEYTLAEFKKDALAAIHSILEKGKLPMVVGGTGLYVQAVIDNWEIPEVAPNPRLRRELEEKIEREGLKKVFDELVALDPEAAYIVDGNNSRRVVRALEIAIATGKPFSAGRKKSEGMFDVLRLGIEPSREVLRARIDARVDEMMRAGLVKEVRALVKKYGTRCIAFDAIGYREIIPARSAASSGVEIKTAIELIKKNTWAYARRQMTWFRKDKKINWIKDVNEAELLAKTFLLR